jgi:hypothetical protein
MLHRFDSPGLLAMPGLMDRNEWSVLLLLTWLAPRPAPPAVRNMARTTECRAQVEDELYCPKQPSRAHYSSFLAQHLDTVSKCSD